MATDIITTIVTPADDYTLTTLANVKLDLGIPTGATFTTSADTPSGNVLPFAGTFGINKGAQASGLNIQPGSTVQVISGTAITLSAVLLGDVPAATPVLIGADVSADAFLTRAILMNSTAIQTYVGMQFAVETIQDQINFVERRADWQNDNSLTCIQLSKGPGCVQPTGWMLSVMSVVVTINGVEKTLVEDTDFIVDVNKAQLIRISETSGLPINWRPYLTTIIYEAGYTTIPADIDDACSRMVKKAFWARGRDPSIMEQSQGGLGSTKYWVTTAPEGNLPPEICDILDKYRTIVFA